MYRQGHITYGFIRFVRPRDKAMETRDLQTFRDHKNGIAKALGFSTIDEFGDKFNSFSHSERVRLRTRYKELEAANPEPISEIVLFEENLQAGAIAKLKEDHDSKEWVLVDIWKSYEDQNGLSSLNIGPQRSKTLGIAEYHVAVQIVRTMLDAGPDDVQAIDLKRHPAFQSRALLRRDAPCAIHARLADLCIEEIDTASLYV
jgi:hypothetical protein